MHLLSERSPFQFSMKHDERWEASGTLLRQRFRSIIFGAIIITHVVRGLLAHVPQKNFCGTICALTALGLKGADSSFLLNISLACQTAFSYFLYWDFSSRPNIKEEKSGLARETNHS